MVRSVTIRTVNPQGTGAGLSLDMKDSLENLIFQNIPGLSFSAGQTYDVDPTTTSLLISTERLASANYLQPGGLLVHLDASSYSGTGPWLDLSGNGIDATVNGASWSSDAGGSFVLDGTDDTLSIPHVAQMGLTSSAITIQVWVKVSALPVANEMPIFGKQSSDFQFDGYHLAVNPSGTIGSMTNGQTRQRSATSTESVVQGQWHLVTMYASLSGVANTTRVCLDDMVVISTRHGEDTCVEQNPFYLGWIGSGLNAQYLNGSIGAMYFYTRELTHNETMANFEFTKGRYIGT